MTSPSVPAAPRLGRGGMHARSDAPLSPCSIAGGRLRVNSPPHKSPAERLTYAAPGCRITAEPPGTKGGFCAPRASQGRTFSRRLYAAFDGFDEVKQAA